MKNTKLKRGQIFLVQTPVMPDREGTQCYKIRPAIIVSNSNDNAESKHISIIYMTGKENPELSPTHVKINKFGIAMCEQIHTIDRECFIDDHKYQCSEAEMQKISQILANHLGLRSA